MARASIANKDQSYFLHAMPGNALAHTLFPIGDLQKSEVRRLAREQTLPVFDKKDSTGICFIGERPFAQFLETPLPAQPGHIETLEGRRVWSASRTHVLHARSAPGLRHRRTQRCRRSPLVRGRQGPRSQCAHCRARP